jgi:predicted nucleotidyltransferase
MFVETNYSSALPEIIRRLLRVSAPEKIILFGSYARGDIQPDSDIDLLVVLRDVKSPRAEITRLRQALRGLLVPVDVVVATPQQIEQYGHVNGLIYQSALTEGKVLYERPAAV